MNFKDLKKRTEADRGLDRPAVRGPFAALAKRKALEPRSESLDPLAWRPFARGRATFSVLAAVGDVLRRRRGGRRGQGGVGLRVSRCLVSHLPQLRAAERRRAAVLVVAARVVAGVVLLRRLVRRRATRRLVGEIGERRRFREHRVAERRRPRRRRHRAGGRGGRASAAAVGAAVGARARRAVSAARRRRRALQVADTVSSILDLSYYLQS